MTQRCLLLNLPTGQLRERPWVAFQLHSQALGGYLSPAHVSVTSERSCVKPAQPALRDANGARRSAGRLLHPSRAPVLGLVGDHACPCGQGGSPVSIRRAAGRRGRGSSPPAFAPGSPARLAGIRAASPLAPGAGQMALPSQDWLSRLPARFPPGWPHRLSLGRLCGRVIVRGALAPLGSSCEGDPVWRCRGPFVVCLSFGS